MNHASLTIEDINLLIEAADGSRYVVRNQAMLLLMFRHGLWVSEVCRLSYFDVDLKRKWLHVKRIMRGVDTVHPLLDDEVDILLQWFEERQALKAVTDDLFITEKGTRLSTQMVWYFIKGYAQKAGLMVRVTPGQLRHACGYTMSAHGCQVPLIKDYLGRKTEVSVERYVLKHGQPGSPRLHSKLEALWANPIQLKLWERDLPQNRAKWRLPRPRPVDYRGVISQALIG
jgi:type 1 fimbriae regulatory protein FimB